MKKLLVSFVYACTVLMMVSCASMSTTTKSTLIGTAAGTAVGAGVGALIGKNAKGTIIGAASGAAVGATAGVIIGKKMQAKKDALAKALADAQVETTTDTNGLTAIKVTLSSGILFDTNKSNLSASAKSALKTFATQMSDADMQNAAIEVLGHTDNTGTAAVNEKLSKERALAVSNYLQSCGIAASRLTSEGCSYNDPVASNETAAGRAQNRRVELYILATDAMVQQYSE